MCMGGSAVGRIDECCPSTTAILVSVARQRMMSKNDGASTANVSYSIIQTKIIASQIE